MTKEELINKLENIAKFHKIQIVYDLESAIKAIEDAQPKSTIIWIDRTHAQTKGTKGPI